MSTTRDTSLANVLREITVSLSIVHFAYSFLAAKHRKRFLLTNNEPISSTYSLLFFISYICKQICANKPQHTLNLSLNCESSAYAECNNNTVRKHYTSEDRKSGRCANFQALVNISQAKSTVNHQNLAPNSCKCSSITSAITYEMMNIQPQLVQYFKSKFSSIWSTKFAWKSINSYENTNILNFRHGTS